MASQPLKLWKNNFALILICLLFLVTRLYKISEIPQSVYWDEASIGYNAYSVLTTGRDEWGEFMPLHFRAFGEFKLPIYIYSVLVTESAFGLTPFAVRLPAVIYGLFSVIGLYLLVLKLTGNKLLSLISSYLFSITPWFFIFSRTGYEAVAGLAFFIWAIYFLLLSIKNSKFFFVISTLLFVLSAYSYNSFRILTPIVLGLGLLYFLFKKKYAIVGISTLILLASMFPLYKLYREDSGLSRFQTVGSKNIIRNYIKNFSPNYLFVTGDTNPRSQIPNTGQLYYLDALFIILGIFYILKSKSPKLYLVFGLLLIAPIPAMITKENPHSLRAILMSPILSVISAMGIYYVTESRKFLVWVIVGVYLIFFASYFYKFVKNYNDLSKSSWQYEYKEIFINQKEGCVSDEFAQPYIFALFYNNTDPIEFIKTRKLNPVSDWGFSTVKSFGGYTFPKICKN